MADLNVERKRGASWIWWLLGLIVVALILWWLLGSGDDEDEMPAVTAVEEPVAATVPAAAPPAVATGVIPVVVIVADPTPYAGQSVSGTANVAEVISDRGFWIEQEGQRVFVVIDEPVPETVDINAGQTVSLTGTVYTPETMDQVPGPLEPDAQEAVQGQPAFLYVRAQDIEITERPQSP